MLVIIASGFVGTVLGVAAFVGFSRFYPLYGGEVLFEVRSGVSDSRDLGVNDIAADQLVFRLAKTETMLLTSRGVLETAMRDPEIRRTTWFRNGYVADDGTELVDLAVDDLIEDLRTSVLRNTNVFGLSWSTHRATDVPVVLNTIGDAYLAERKALDDTTYSDNISVFRRQLAETQRDIEDLETEIQSFIRNRGLETLQDPRDSQIAFSMQQLSEQITQATERLSYARSALAVTSEKLQGSAKPSSEDRAIAELDPAIASHNHKVLEIKTELRELYGILKPDHPQIKRLERRLDATTEERDKKIEQVIRRNLEARLKEMDAEVNQLTSALDTLADEYEAKGMLLRNLAADQSAYETMNTRLEYLVASRDADLQLIKEAQLLRLRTDASRVRKTIPALEPREVSFPRIEIVVPLSVMLVVCLTVGVIFLRELTDQRVKSASDLTVVPGARLLGIVPDVSEDPTNVDAAELVVREFPNSVLAESYRQAFGSLTKTVDRAGHQSIVMLGGLPGSGTTTAVSNLAATWAAAGRRVVVIDANFRRPRLAETMGVSSDSHGLADVLAGVIDCGSVVQHAEGDIDVISAGTPAHRVFERLTTRRFDSLLAELRDSYDLIIFDAPPAVVASESMILASKVDAAALIVRANREHRGLVARLIHQLGDAHCDLLGVLLNRPRGTAGGYFKKNFAAMAAYTAQSDG